MEKILKHITIYDNGQFEGRYAIKLDGNFLRVKNVSGGALQVKHLINVLNTVNEFINPINEFEENDNFVTKIDKLHRNRVYQWRVKVKKGSSGCLDFWVESLVDPEMGIIKKGRRLHVSMYRKFNEGIEISLADLFGIINHPEFPDDWYQYDDDGVEVKIFTPNFEGFNPPSNL